MAHTAEIPSDLRVRLETARLDLLALFRALDRMQLRPTEIPKRLIYINCLNWMPITPRPSGHWTNPRPAWIFARCSAILWRRSTDYRKLVPGSVPISPVALMPFWSDWKSPFAEVWIQQRLTAWCPVAAPETVKVKDPSFLMQDEPKAEVCF